MSRLFVLTIAACALSSASLNAQSVVEQVVVVADTVSVVDSVRPIERTVFINPKPAGLAGARLVAIDLPDIAGYSDGMESRFAEQDTVRRKAVAYGDWYARRLRIHRYGSYAMLPLFVTQYVLGNKLLNQKEDQYAGTRTTPIDKGLRSTHVAVASAVGVLFVVNTTTGLWNLFESRHTVEGRKLRTIHALTMLAADAGFLYVGSLSKNAVDHGPPDARKHRNAALVSFGISTAGASLMWFRRD